MSRLKFVEKVKLNLHWEISKTRYSNSNSRPTASPTHISYDATELSASIM